MGLIRIWVESSKAGLEARRHSAEEVRLEARRRARDAALLREQAVLHWGLIRAWIRCHKSGLEARRRARVRDEYITNTGRVIFQRLFGRKARDQVTELKGGMDLHVAAYVPTATMVNVAACSLPELQFEQGVWKTNDTTRRRRTHQLLHKKLNSRDVNGRHHEWELDLCKCLSLI